MVHESNDVIQVEVNVLEGTDSHPSLDEVAQDMAKTAEPGVDAEDTAMPADEDADAQQIEAQEDVKEQPTSIRSTRSVLNKNDVIEFASKWKTALQTLLEIAIRVIPIALVLYGVVAGVGYLIYFASASLLKQAMQSGWTQIWSEHRVPEIEHEFMNQTFVELYAGLHRDESMDPLAPHYETKWLYAYYLRMTFVATVGFGVPWFTLIVTQGWGRVQKYFLMIFLPQAIILNAYGIAAASYTDATGTPLLSDLVERGLGFLFALIQLVIAIPFTARALKLQHYIKSLIIPYLFLWAALIALRYVVPTVILGLDNDWHKAIFRLVVFTAMGEVFVGGTRMVLRFIPLSAEAEMRPEDKSLIVLSMACLFQYWGRVIMMDLKETYPQLLCSFGLGLIEFLARVFVVQRDKLYMTLALRSKQKRDDYWGANQPGMGRFRCSTIYMSFLIEYFMMISAFSFSYYSGLTRGKDMSSLFTNLAFQVASEIMTDVSAGYVELFVSKLPIIQAWRNRHKHWTVIFGSFVIVFQLFAISQTGGYFCAVRNPKYGPSEVGFAALKYCGAEK